MTGSESGDAATGRWAWAEVDTDAIGHNVGVLAERVAPAAVWAVVKANGYGHGAVDVARAALNAGAEGLCVALVQEGIELRRAGIDAPILLLSEQPPELAADLVRHHLIPTVYRAEYIAALAAVAPAAGLDVHLLVDTGMRRVGVHPDDVASVTEAIARHAPAIRLEGVYTHLAAADDCQPELVEFTEGQIATLDRVLEALPPVPVIHAANSAGALAHPTARRSFVRLGIAMYGISPGADLDPLCDELIPAMSLRSRVSFVKRVPAGTGISYGLRHRLERDATVATIPLGYADGVPRRLWSVGGEVLVAGRRCPIVGVVTMDQLMVDCGDADVRIGDAVTLIGRQGDQTIRAEDWARALDTIGYEIVCGISGRVPRVRPRSIEA